MAQGPARDEQEFLAQLQQARQRASQTGSPPARAGAPRPASGAPKGSLADPSGARPGGGRLRGDAQQEAFFYQGAQAQRPASMGSRSASARAAGARSGRYIEAGTLVHVVLETGVNSELPGQLIGRVAQPVWNRTIGQIVVPSGAKVLGVYNARVERGQSRVQVAWTRLILPSGQAVSLANVPGTSLDGSSGLEARVDEHFDRMLAGAALSSVFSASSAVIAGGTNTLQVDPRQQAVYGAARPAQQLGQEYASRYLQVEPTLRLDPGERVGLLATRDVSVP